MRLHQLFDGYDISHYVVTLLNGRIVTGGVPPPGASRRGGLWCSCSSRLTLEVVGDCGISNSTQTDGFRSLVRSFTWMGSCRCILRSPLRACTGSRCSGIDIIIGKDFIIGFGWVQHHSMQVLGLARNRRRLMRVPELWSRQRCSLQSDALGVASCESWHCCRGCGGTIARCNQRTHVGL